MKCACGCKSEIVTIGGSVFRDGRWWFRAHYNAMKVEAQEAHVNPSIEQYKRDKMRSEVDNVE